MTQTLRETMRIQEFDSDGREIAAEETSWVLRWSYRQEMRYLFELTGFELEALYSDFATSPPVYGREQVWVVRRP